VPDWTAVFSAAAADEVASCRLVGLSRAATPLITLFSAASDLVAEVDDVRHGAGCRHVTRVTQQQPVVIAEHPATAGGMACQTSVLRSDLHSSMSLETPLVAEAAIDAQSWARLSHVKLELSPRFASCIKADGCQLRAVWLTRSAEWTSERLRSV